MKFLRMAFTNVLSNNPWLAKLYYWMRTNPKTVGQGLVLVLSLWFVLLLANRLFYVLVGVSGFDFNPLSFFASGMMAWPNHVMRAKWIVSGLIPMGVLGFVVYSFSHMSKKLYGDAHWSTKREAKEAGLLAAKGILLTKKWGQYLVAGGYEHIFVFWPSGSGKTNSLAIPNLLNWPGSCIVNDVKLTMFKATSKFRQFHGQQCFVWNPVASDYKTHCYNPLDVINRDKNFRIDGLQKIAHIFIPDSTTQKEPIWTAVPRSLFVALGLYLMDTPTRPCTIGEMMRIIKNSANLNELLSSIVLERTDLDPLTYRNLISYLQTEPKLQTNLIQSFLAYFELFDNPLIDAATSKSDFDIRDLRKKRMTIYIGVSANDLRRLSPLITVFYEQVVDEMLRNIPDPKTEPHDLLLLLDEFSALKRMEILRSSIGLMREYHVRVMAFIQDLPQLYETYGVHGAKSFINNKIRIASVQNDRDSAHLVSDWLGHYTVDQRSTSTKVGLMAAADSDSVSVSSAKRPLLYPHEIMRLHKKKMLIVCEGSSPIMADKNFWQDDHKLKNRAIGAIELPEIRPVIVPFNRASIKVVTKPAPIVEEEEALEEA